MSTIKRGHTVRNRQLERRADDFSRRRSVSHASPHPPGGLDPRVIRPESNRKECL